MLSLEVIKALTDDVELVDLTGDWIRDVRMSRKLEDWFGRKLKGRTFGVKFISLIAEVNDVL